jgi:hypothetical protein
MKKMPISALGAFLIGSAGVADAGSIEFFFGSRQEPRNECRYEDDRRYIDDDDDDDDDYSRRGGRGWERDRGCGERQPVSIEALAQVRLRELGYYRGGIDGSFGRGSRMALARFQHDHGLRPTGWLDEHTLHALQL